MNQPATLSRQISPGITFQRAYLAFVEAVCALKRVTRRMRNADSGAWRCLASAIEAQGGTGKARAAADEAVRIWARNYDAGNAVLEEARRYAQKLSQ